MMVSKIPMAMSNSLPLRGLSIPLLKKQMKGVIRISFWKIGQSLGEVRTQAWVWPSGVLTRKKSSETQSCASIRPPLHYMWWMTHVLHAKYISLHSRAAWARQLVLLVMHWVFLALLITMVFITWETQNSYFHANFPLWFWALFGSWNERECFDVVFALSGSFKSLLDC